jgi:hypothetical protein
MPKRLASTEYEYNGMPRLRRPKTKAQIIASQSGPAAPVGKKQTLPKPKTKAQIIASQSPDSQVVTAPVVAKPKKAPAKDSK